MAGTMAGLWSLLGMLYIISFMGVHIIAGVKIDGVAVAIRARDTDDCVKLPCNFTTDTYETPQISWYTGKGHTPVMRYDIHNRLLSYGEWKDRVSRGDRGGLVIHSPTLNDTGNYTCEVEVDNESPNWAKVDVQLVVSSPTTTTSSEIPIRDDTPLAVGGDTGNVFIVAFLCVGWILSIVSAVLFFYACELKILKDDLCKCKCRGLHFVSGILCIIVATILLIASTVYTTKYFTSVTTQEKKQASLICLYTDVVAIGFHVLLLVVHFILKPMCKRCQSTSSQGTDQEQVHGKGKSARYNYAGEGGINDSTETRKQSEKLIKPDDATGASVKGKVNQFEKQNFHHKDQHKGIATGAREPSETMQADQGDPGEEKTGRQSDHPENGMDHTLGENLPRSSADGATICTSKSEPNQEKYSEILNKDQKISGDEDAVTPLVNADKCEEIERKQLHNPERIKHLRLSEDGTAHIPIPKNTPENGGLSIEC